jgi:hypothetical protein
MGSTIASAWTSDARERTFDVGRGHPHSVAGRPTNKYRTYLGCWQGDDSRRWRHYMIVRANENGLSIPTCRTGPGSVNQRWGGPVAKDPANTQAS